MTTISDLSKTGALFNGMIASNLTILLVHPVYTIKTRMMTTGRFPPFSQMYWGLSENLVCDASNQMAGFLGIKIFSDAIGARSRELTEKEGFLGGMFAGFLTSPLLSCTERMMILAQNDVKAELRATPLVQSRLSQKAHQVAGFILNIWQKEGIKGFIKGTPLTACRESTNMAFFFGLQKVAESEVKKLIKDTKETNSLANNVASFATYGLVGMISGWITTPMDLIKTRIQAEIGNHESGWKCAARIVKEQGLKSLFTGGTARMATIGLTWCVLGPTSKKVRQILLDVPYFRKNHDN